MPLEEPPWWYGEGERPRLLVPILVPLAYLYGAVTQARFMREPYRASLPVICAGNFTAGGTGKTPLAILIARLLMARGETPAFLSRGYGGCERGPAWVEVGPGAATRFGDEPLLLARIAPTVVARDRAAGAQLIEATGGISAIIMDDGLQNPTLAKDLTLAVVDGERGLGNGEVVPAGPLRAPIDFQLGLVDAIVVRERERPPVVTSDIHALLRRQFPGPVLATRSRTAPEAAHLAEHPVVAFAGISNPNRFFALLDRLGVQLQGRVVFPDHHVYTRADVDRLVALAKEKGARLVTTEKDWVRLDGGEDFQAELAARAYPLAIELELDERDFKRLVALLEAALQGDARLQPAAGAG